MKTLLKTYTHPVIGNSDDISGAFDVSFSVVTSEDKKDWLIDLSASIDNTEINRLISIGAVGYLLEVECPSTFYRGSFVTGNQKERITIPSNRLRGKVQMDVALVALIEIPDYTPSDQHPDYGNRSFAVSVGDILGDGGRGFFTADTEFDPLRAAASSFIKIRRGTAPKGNIEVAHGPEEIVIHLSKQDWQQFQEVSSQTTVSDILHSAIVFPVLIEAVQNAQKDNKEANDRLKAILEQRNLMRQHPFDAAQEILRAPVSRALQRLFEIKESSQ